MGEYFFGDINKTISKTPKKIHPHSNDLYLFSILKNVYHHF